MWISKYLLLNAIGIKSTGVVGDCSTMSKKCARVNVPFLKKVEKILVFPMNLRLAYWYSSFFILCRYREEGSFINFTF